ARQPDRAKRKPAAIMSPGNDRPIAQRRIGFADELAERPRSERDVVVHGVVAAARRAARSAPALLPARTAAAPARSSAAAAAAARGAAAPVTAAAALAPTTATAAAAAAARRTVEHGHHAADAAHRNFGRIAVVAVLVLPLAGAQLAFDVDLAAFAQTTLRHADEPVGLRRYGVPLGAFLARAGRLGLPVLRGRNARVGDAAAVLEALHFRI